MELAKTCHWRVYHTWRSDHSPSGFPDLCLVRGRRLVFAEVKAQGGKLSVAQCVWLDALAGATGEVFVWRPSDWPEVEATLR